MLRRIFYLSIFSCLIFSAKAQMGGGGGNMQSGHFYGKIVDAKTGKPIDAASIQLVTTRRNTAVVSSKDSIVNGQLTESNGDFSLENVGLLGNYRLIVTAIGYKAIELPVSFFTAEQQQKLMAAMQNRQGATQPVSVAVPDTTIRMQKDTNMLAATDSLRKASDSTNLPTQQLTTIIDSAQMRANPRPDIAQVDSTKRNNGAAAPATTQPGRGGNGANRGNMMEAFRKAFGNDLSFLASQSDKDLGNIKLDVDAATLGNVTVTASQPVYTLGIDRKVFNVDRALTSQGQSAVEVLRQVPAVNVDIDGNVTLRNSSPTLFVDGRPTTLTLDQIPADAIQNIEVITNPSAKFDASGGTASILNVVMKKNRKNGYNGTIRAGADSRGRFNGGGDINLRQKKVNLFLSGQYSQRKSKAWTDVLTRYNPDTNSTGALVPAYNLTQNSYSVNTGGFGFIRGGFDYFMDNRNTFTLSASYNRGSFKNNTTGDLRYDTLTNPARLGFGSRTTLSDGLFRNWGGSGSYKHSFAKTGHEITADVNLNSSRSNNDADVNNSFYNDLHVIKGTPSLTQTVNATKSTLWVIQSDYANPISDKAKIEAGVRAQIRSFNSTNRNYLFNDSTQRFESQNNINSDYKYQDQVYAAYATFTGKVGKLGYNAGLRAESSNYDGTQMKTTGDSAFNVQFPVSLFPSAFLSYKLSDKQDLQFNYTRRINRPSFFQLIPFTDYTDQQNLTRGNANLRPEFTNSLEANYNYQINNGNNILASVYYKNTENLITRYYDKVYNPNIDQEVQRGTYVNANSSNSYGLELTSRNTISRMWDITTNVNFYNATINGSNIGTSGNTNSRFSYFGKINTNYRLGKNTSWTIQVNADYQGKSVLPANSGGGGGGRGGGGGFFGNSNQAAGTNGYVNPFGGLDLALKKEFLKNKAASITISMQDVLKTRKRSTYILTDFYDQDYSSRRDQQVLRVQFNWRFGRQDVNLFKRKNSRGDNDNGGDMQGMPGQ